MSLITKQQVQSILNTIKTKIGSLETKVDQLFYNNRLGKQVNECTNGLYHFNSSSDAKENGFPYDFGSIVAISSDWWNFQLIFFAKANMPVLYRIKITNYNAESSWSSLYYLDGTKYEKATASQASDE